MNKILIILLVFTLINCENNTRRKVLNSNLIIEASIISYDDLSKTEKDKLRYARCCCYPNNWNRGVNCIELEKAFYVKTKINNILLAEISESDVFSVDKLITSNPNTLYGKYHNRWEFENGKGEKICETSKFEGHNHIKLFRKDSIDELIIGPIPKKPGKILIKLSDSKYYRGLKPESVIKNKKPIKN